MPQAMIFPGPGNYPASAVLAASADYKAVDPAALEFSPLGAKGVTVFTNVTAASGGGGVTVNVEAFDPASGTWFALLTSTLVATVTTNTLIVDPRVAASANVAAQKPLWPRMRVRAVGSGTRTTLNYSIGIAASA